MDVWNLTDPNLDWGTPTRCSHGTREKGRRHRLEEGLVSSKARRQHGDNTAARWWLGARNHRVHSYLWEFKTLGSQASQRDLKQET